MKSVLSDFSLLAEVCKFFKDEMLRGVIGDNGLGNFSGQIFQDKMSASFLGVPQLATVVLKRKRKLVFLVIRKCKHSFLNAENGFSQISIIKLFP